MSYADSEPSEAVLVLHGVWVHDPLSPDTSARQYLYGGSVNEGRVVVASSSTHYAGREYPVTDFGEHLTSGVGVTITVPFGPDWARQVSELVALPAQRRSLFFRDGRGRAMLAAITSVRDRDTQWGTSVQFDAERG